MKVRVKEGRTVFYSDKLWTEGEEFVLIPREHSVLKDSEGKPVKISVAEQFSELAMNKVEEPKKPGRPKKSEKSETL